MARALGYNCKLYLDGYDRSADSTAFMAEASADTVDITSLGSAGWKAFQATLKGGNANFDIMWDPAVGGVSPQINALIGSTIIPTISVNEAGAVGDSALVLPPCILEKNGIEIKVADIIRQPVALKVTGSVGLGGLVMQPLAQKTTTGSAASIDNAAATTAGGRVNFHVTQMSGGNVRLLIEDSADNSSFATIADSQSIAAIGGVSVEISGSIRRYARATWSAIGTNATFVVALARY